MGDAVCDAAVINPVGSQMVSIETVEQANKVDLFSSMSKSKLKKLRRKNYLQEKRLSKRKEEKERKKDRKRARLAAGLHVPGRVKTRVKACSSEMISKFVVVLDLDFNEYMSAGDCGKVAKQVTRCYSENWKSRCPLQMHLTSFCGPMKDVFLKAQPGCLNWHVTQHEKSFLNCFEREKIVYLTAESENVLDAVYDEEVYVIGGLVDHNQHKGLCYRLANERGLRHAKLPIDEYVKLSSRKVLAINHVFEILLKFQETKSWETAFFAVIPKRKGVTLLEGSLPSGDGP